MPKKMGVLRKEAVYVKKSSLVVFFFIFLLLVYTSSAASASASGLSGDLIPEKNDNHNDDSIDSSSSDGGFSSFDSMLHWAIGHSDPDKLKEAASKGLSPSDLQTRQSELHQLLQDLKAPSDTQLMQFAIDDLNNSSLSLQHHLSALQDLLILVEPIHNAMDLDKRGGFTTIIRALDSSHPEIRISSAWLLGKSCQNNSPLQDQILLNHHEALPKLMEMTQSDRVDEAGKALYAVSALVRNNLHAQDLFYGHAGVKILQDLMSNSSIDMGLRRKAIVLVADLVESQLEAKSTNELAYFGNSGFLKSVVDLTGLSDIDLQEKALIAIKHLLQMEKIEGLILKEDCGLDKALESMKHKLEDVMEDEERRDYAMDVESLRREVELIFDRKIGKV